MLLSHKGVALGKTSRVIIAIFALALGTGSIAAVYAWPGTVSTLGAGIMACGCLLIALACASGPAALAARRLIAAAIFAACVGYVLSEWGKPLPSLLTYQRGGANGINAVLDLCLFGIPAATYALTGKMPQRIAERNRQRQRELDLQNMALAGDLVATDYRALRAFQLPATEDEGPQYFLELEDEAVLFLGGLYLLPKYNIAEDTAGSDNPAAFPCTDFTVRRWVDGGEVMAIACRGEKIIPEMMARGFTDVERNEWILEDGDVIRDVSYQSLRARFARVV